MKLTLDVISKLSILAAGVSIFIQVKKSRDDANNRAEDIQREATLRDLDDRRENFKQKFYERLRMLKSNQNDIIVNDRRGHKAFEQLYIEFKYICYVLDIIIQKNTPEFNFSEELKIGMCYDVLFSGFGKKGFYEIPMDHEKKDYVWFQKALQIEIAKEKQLLSNNSFLIIHDKNSNMDKIRYYEDIFSGQHAQLGHYYRQLFHLVSFVATTKTLDWNEKYDYIKLIRSQLSNHEQALLFFNACWIGEKWWSDKEGEHKYFLDYAIIKNIPFELTENVGIDIEKTFYEKLGDEPPFYKKGKEVSKEVKLAWLFEATDK